jgi:hypothetical protein
MVAGGGSEAGIYGRLPLLRLPLCELPTRYSLAVQETKWAQRRGLVVPASVCQSGVPAHRVLRCVRLVSSLGLCEPACVVTLCVGELPRLAPVAFGTIALRYLRFGHVPVHISLSIYALVPGPA